MSAFVPTHKAAAPLYSRGLKNVLYILNIIKDKYVSGPLINAFFYKVKSEHIVINGYF